MMFEGLRSRWMTRANEHTRRSGIPVQTRRGIGRGPHSAGALLEQGSERSALDQPHREVRPEFRVQSQLVHGKNARMLKLASDLGLLDEAPDHRAIPGMTRVEHFHRDVAAQVGVAPLEDDTHAAASDLAEDMVSPLPTAGEPVVTQPDTDHRRRGVGLVAQ